MSDPFASAMYEAADDAEDAEGGAAAIATAPHRRARAGLPAFFAFLCLPAAAPRRLLAADPPPILPRARPRPSFFPPNG